MYMKSQIMAALPWFKLCALLCLLPCALCKLSPAQKGKVCRRDMKCLWVDPEKKHGLPLRSTMEYGSGPDIYCYEGIDPYSTKGLLYSWHSLHVYVLTSKSEGLSMVVSNSSEAIRDSTATSHYEDVNVTEGKCLSPHKLHCIGIKHSGASHIDSIPYAFDAKLKLRYYYPILLVIGLFLLFAAPNLSRNMPILYGTGITIGIIASVLVVLYVFSKFVPKKNMLGLGILAGGYTVIVSFFYWCMRNVFELSKTHWQYVILYIVGAGLITFAVLYRMGPVTNTRTFDLIQWGIQLVALVLLYFSNELMEIRVLTVVAALMCWFIPAKYNPIILLFSWTWYFLSCVFAPFYLCCKCLSFLNPLNWFSWRPKHRFLTEEEYQEQGRVETAKALNELREYCKNNEMWDTIGNLKDSKRFTRFLSGRNHVTEEEKVDHEWSFMSNDSELETVDYSDYEGDTPSPHPSVSFSSTHSSAAPYSDDSLRHSHTPPQRASEYTPPHHRDTSYRSPYRPHSSSRSRYDSPASSRPRRY